VGITDMVMSLGGGESIIVFANDGIHKSTDGGTSWVHYNSGIEGLYLTTLANHPFDFLTIIAGTLNNGAFISFDAGESWEPFGTGMENETINDLNYALFIFDAPWSATTLMSGVWNLNTATEVWEQINNGNNNLNNAAITSDSKCQLYLASFPNILTSPCKNILWQPEIEFPATSDFAVTADD